MTNTVIYHQDVLGTLWTVGWLFTIGYFQLNFKKGFFALIVWPYYLGKHFSKGPMVGALAEHYICLGGCRGVSKKPGVCGAKDCKDHNHALVKCNCTDGLHNNFQA